MDKELDKNDDLREHRGRLYDKIKRLESECQALQKQKADLQGELDALTPKLGTG